MASVSSTAKSVEKGLETLLMILAWEKQAAVQQEILQCCNVGDRT
jgi:hypothetical protein